MLIKLRSMNVNVLSYCDGMSCGQIALRKLGIHVDNYYATEIKESAMVTTKSNFPKTKYLGDLTQLTQDKLLSLGKIDLFISGTPCKDFSQANRVRLGLQGEKSSLFYSFLSALEIVKPKYFFFENVKMSKEDEQEITTALGVSPTRVNASAVSGVLRDRLYWTNIPFKGDLTNRNKKLQSYLDYGYTEREKSRCFLESDSRPLKSEVKMFHRHYTTGFTNLIFKDKQHYLDCVEYYIMQYKSLPAKDITNNPDIFKGVRYMSVNERSKLHGIPLGYFDVVRDNEAFGLIGDGWSIDVVVEFFKGL